MEDHAFLASVHMEPPSRQVSQIDVVVGYHQKEMRLRIHLAPPLSDDPPTKEFLAQEFRELGEALLRIADHPSAIYDHNPHRNRS